LFACLNIRKRVTFLWGSLKHNTYKNNPHTRTHTGRNSANYQASSIGNRQKIWTISKNMSTSCSTGLGCDGDHPHHLPFLCCMLYFTGK